MENTLLAGVRVIDLTRTIAGPSATQALGDFGAEVIKVERPGAGDEGRGLGPTFLKGRDGRNTGEGSMYLVANRNKRGITLDFSRPEGQTLLRRLVAEADIFVENFKTGDLERFGLDYPSLQSVNPRLIYCSITGYGQTGPYRGRPGYDPIFQALAGWMSVNGIGVKPMLVASNPVDTITGYQAAIGILAALRHRDKSGVGQHVDVALLDVAIAACHHRAVDYLLTGQQPRRRGLTGYVYQCADGQMLIGVANPDQWVRFCEVLGLPHLVGDQRFNTYPMRLKNAAELHPILEAATDARTTADLGRALEAANIPFGPVYGFEQMFEDPHVQAREMEVAVEHPLSDDLRLIANPLKFSRTPITTYEPPPLLGEHTDRVLEELLQLNCDEIAVLREKGVI